MRNVFSFGCLIVSALMVVVTITELNDRDVRIANHEGRVTQVEMLASALVEEGAAQAYATTALETAQTLAQEGFEANKAIARALKTAENVSASNLELRQSVANARTVVHVSKRALAQTQIALDNATEQLRGQIADTNRCIDRIRTLESFITTILERLPPEDRLEIPEMFTN